MLDETALRELLGRVIEKQKLLTGAEFAKPELPPDGCLPPVGGVQILFYNDIGCDILNS